MYKLTQKRLEKAIPILEKYRAYLVNNNYLSAWSLDVELRNCWNIGYQELKGIMEDMLKHDRYRYVAVYYMQHCNHAGGLKMVISEFQEPLAKVWGLKWCPHDDKNPAVVAFWEKFKQENQKTNLK